MTLVEEMVYQLSQAFPQTPNFSFGFANIIWHFESSWVFFTLIKKYIYIIYKCNVNLYSNFLLIFHITL